jgi:hypothetical protein
METVDDEVLGDIARKIQSPSDGLNPKAKGIRCTLVGSFARVSILVH